ncbi:MAG: allophanate hydrolase subunit 1 [Actinomycetota bacterium]|nr:allophanate hydrolase subunit 1 [Actinomycetota bacterium]
MRLLACGDAAVLAEVDDLEQAMALHAAVVAEPPPGVVDLVPAARTLLVRFAPDKTSPGEVAKRLRSVRSVDQGAGSDADEVVLEVTYDGPDLADVAELTGLSEQEVVELHTTGAWTVAFVGFAPGFGYLVGGDERLHVARRKESRTAVPAGSVGLAGEFSGAYPRESPGGWQLIGRTDARLWDVERDPPALLVPGTRVRFEAVG